MVVIAFDDLLPALISDLCDLSRNEAVRVELETSKGPAEREMAASSKYSHFSL